MKVIRTVTVLFLLCVPLNFVIGMPAMYREFYIQNMTGKQIIYTGEVAPSESTQFGKWERYFFFEENDKILFQVPIFEWDRRRFIPDVVIEPGISAWGFRWAPTENWQKIPPLERIKLFYSVLTIRDSEGKILMTLDAIREDDFTTTEYGDIFLVIK
jgi:hypothetical protein